MDIDFKKLAPWNWFKKEQEEQQSTASLPVQRNDLPVAGGPVSPILQLHREIDRLFDDTFRGFGFPALAMPRWPSDWPGLLKPALDIQETDKQYKIALEVPGVEEKDIQITLDNDVLMVCGEKRQEQEKKDKSKFERNLNIILEILKQDPENCDYLGYLGDTYSSDGKNEEARDAYKKAVAAMPEKLGVYDQRSSYTYTNLLRVSQCLNAPEAEVEAIYKEAVEKLPKEPDFDCVMGDWYWRKGQYEKAVQMYELAIAKLETYGTVNRGIITTSMLIQMYECLGEGCRKLGDYQKAVRYCVIVLNTDHKDMNALLTLINCFTESNVSAEEVFQFLGKIYDYSDIKDKVILLRVAMAIGRKDLERMFRGILLPQEREEFDAAMETAQSGAPLS